MKIFIDSIDKSKYPGGWYKFHCFLQQALVESSQDCVASARDADFIISHLLNDKIQTMFDPSKLIILDWTDSSSFASFPCLIYFKKSWSQNVLINGVFVKFNPNNVLSHCRPLQEMALPCYFRPCSEIIEKKELVCVLRNTGKGDSPNRCAVLNILKNMNISKANIGALHINKFGKEWFGGQPKKHLDYLDFISTAKIIVTCGPSSWEGDSRLWESLASGACVVTDRIYADMGHNPIEGKHCFYYDIDRLDRLCDLLNGLFQDSDLCKRVGDAGRMLALNHHSPAQRLHQIIYEARNVSEN